MCYQRGVPIHILYYYDQMWWVGMETRKYYRFGHGNISNKDAFYIIIMTSALIVLLIAGAYYYVHIE